MEVFPVYAGVILDQTDYGTRYVGVPRVCGGDPTHIYQPARRATCSPCMRG